MSLFAKLEEDIPQGTTPLEVALRQSFIRNLKDAFLQPPGRVLAAYAALAFLALVENFRGNPVSPGSITIGILVFAILSVLVSEVESYRVSSLSHDMLRNDAQSAKRAKLGWQSFLFIMMVSLPELLSFAVVVPIVILGPALLAGDYVTGFAPAVFLFVGSFIFVATLRTLSWTYRWLNNEARSPRLLSAKEGFNSISLFIYPVAGLLALSAVAWLGNIVLTKRDPGFEFVFDAMFQTTLLVIATTGALMLLSALWMFRIAPVLFSLLPVQRGRITWGARMVGLIGMFEVSMSILSAVMFITAIALAPLIYSLYAFNPSVLVFLGFNIYCSAHMTLKVIAFSRDLSRPSLRLLRRAGAQYSAIQIVMTNIALALGYSAGWLAKEIYMDPGRGVEDLPFPGLLYGLHSVEPGVLPFTAQVEAAGLTILLLLSISWVQIVISKRAWAEAAIVIFSSTMAAFSPQVLPQLRVFLQQIINSDWTIIHQTPEVLLALLIPAVKSFLGSEVGQVADPGVEDWTRCTSCNEPLEVTDKFCRACGAGQVVNGTE